MMETKRTYWDLPLARTLTTEVLAVEPFPGTPNSDGSQCHATSSPEPDSAKPRLGRTPACRFRVILKETLFHPEGGGQPSDVGVLLLEDRDLQGKLGICQLTVEKVLEEDQQIIHYASVALPGLSTEDSAEQSLLGDQAAAESLKPSPGCRLESSVDPSLLIEQAAAETSESSRDRSPESSGDSEAFAKLLVGASVTCVIDWDVRLDLMQQHTGQHILSRAFEELLDAKTVGFHLGVEYVSVDLAIDSLPEEDASKVEDRTNEIVFSNVPVFAKEFKAGDLPDEIRARLPISAENIRVVYVGDFDACTCAGTHVTASGQVGLVKINQIDRAHGGVRVVFRCGGRALIDYRQKERLLSETARTLSQPLSATPMAVVALTEKAQGLEKALSDAREALLEQEISGMIREATASASSGSGRSVTGSSGARVCGSGTFNSNSVSVSPNPMIRHLPGKNVEELRVAAKRVSEAIKEPTVFFTIIPRFQVVVASPCSSVDARAVTARISAQLGGRGGGTPHFAQVGSKEPLEFNEGQVKAAVLQALEMA